MMQLLGGMIGIYGIGGGALSSRAEICIDLSGIDLGFGPSERRSFLVALRQELAACELPFVSTKVEPISAGTAASKSNAVPIISAIIVGLTATAGYSFYPYQTKQILDAVWKALGKILSKEKTTVVEISINGAAKIKIQANSTDAALALLPASSAVADSLNASKTESAKPKDKNRASTVTLTPKKS
jgi:hypothetical protein